MNITNLSWGILKVEFSEFEGTRVPWPIIDTKEILLFLFSEIYP
jgi:hypothetical protein